MQIASVAPLAANTIVTPKLQALLATLGQAVNEINSIISASIADAPIPMEVAEQVSHLNDASLSALLREQGVTDSGAVAAALRVVWEHITSASTEGGINGVLSYAYPAFTSCYMMTKETYKREFRNRSPLCKGKSAFSGLFAIMHMIDSEAACKTMGYMYRENGIHVPTKIDQLVSTLREGCDPNADPKLKITQKQANAALISVWNHVYAGKSMMMKSRWMDTENYYPTIEGMKKTMIKLAFGENEHSDKVLAVIEYGADYGNHIEVYNAMCDSINSGSNKDLEYVALSKTLRINRRQVKDIVNDLKEIGVFEKMETNKETVTFESEKSVSITN